MSAEVVVVTATLRDLVTTMTRAREKDKPASSQGKEENSEMVTGTTLAPVVFGDGDLVTGK